MSPIVVAISTELHKIISALVSIAVTGPELDPIFTSILKAPVPPLAKATAINPIVIRTKEHPTAASTGVFSLTRDG